MLGLLKQSVFFLFLVLAFEVQAAEFAELSAKRLDGTSVVYYIQTPSLKSKRSVLLVLQGSTCKSVYSSAQAAGGLVDKLGIVRLDIEKYALSKNISSCPREYLEKNTIDQRISDVLLVVSALRNQEWWDRKLFIIGGSEGAVLAAILPTYIPETTKTVIMAGGIGWTMRQEMLFLLEKQMSAKGKTAEEIAQEIKMMDHAFDATIENPTSSKVFYGDTNTYKWWSSILNVRPINYLVNLSIPILLIQGTTDQAVPVESARAAEAVFREMGKGNLKYIEYEGLDHSWNDASGKSQASVVLKDVFEWLSK